MNLDKRIKRKQKALHKAISTKGLMNKHTIRISEQLDILIVQRMRGVINI
jgi:hypothetical protein